MVWSKDLLSRTLFSSEWPEEPTAAVVQKAFSGVSTAALRRSSGRFAGEVVLRFRSAEAARVALEKGATVDGKALKLTPAGVRRSCVFSRVFTNRKMQTQISNFPLCSVLSVEVRCQFMAVFNIQH